MIQGIKLPTMPLPKFDGTYESWLEFKDSFQSLIHHNEQVGAIQKFHYLRASLTSSAAQVIKCLDFSAENYENAWDLVCQRFDNKRLLVHNHIRELFSLPQVTKPSSSGLRELADAVTKHLRCLKILDVSTENWDPMLNYIVIARLDKDTIAEWERQASNTGLSTLNQMLDFLTTKADLLETLEHRERNAEESLRKGNKVAVKKRQQVSLLASSIKCYVCQEQHLIYDCPEFLKATPSERIQQAKTAKLCLNCLRPGHQVNRCYSGPCKKCKKRHNSLLHEEVKLDRNKEAPVSLSMQDSLNPQVLLSTAVVKIKAGDGSYRNCRSILDSGSQSNFVTQATCSELGIEPQKTNIHIVGVNKVTANIHYKCEITIESLYGNFSKKIHCFVLPTIVDDLPSQEIMTSDWDMPKRLNLADPNFKQPGQINLLIGAGLFWEVMLQGRINLGRTKPILQQTKLGWIVSGSINGSAREVQCNVATNSQIHEQLERFWKIEETSSKPVISEEEKFCEEHYKQHTRRQNDGRFTVTIPFKHNLDKLGESRKTALKRLFSVERKFKCDAEFHEKYIQFMRNYETSGHMRKVDKSGNDSIVYYLPHHGVTNPESETTKLRVVFDASAPTTTGWSLNDLQAVGAVIQQDVVCILIRYRQHKYVLSADVKQMYRQIEVTEEQRCLQRILWRYSRNETIDSYELNTVTYGTASGAHLAIRSLYELGLENKEQFPEAAEIILRDFYVDDMHTGAETTEELRKIRKDVTAILKQGCMELHKWKSNNEQIFANKCSNESFSFAVKEGEYAKTLGIRWSPTDDSLLYKIAGDFPTDVTKRNILATIARIFDPLGLVAPCIISAKIILQEIWQCQIDWDDDVPSEIKDKWMKFCGRLHSLNDLRIPRHVLISNSISVELHGFSDASELAYGACIYARSCNSNNEVKVKLICAKSKVAPLKTLTIPRLELMGALLLARLINQVMESFVKLQLSCFYWCDSQIVLCWIKTKPSLLQPFVSNRIAQIQNLTNKDEWRYISTKQNPADVLSRGTLPNKLIRMNIWWDGPSWLREEKARWPIIDHIALDEELPETKPLAKILLSTETNFSSNLFSRYSSFKKLRRVTAYCIRFAKNSRSSAERKLGPLSLEELENSFHTLVRIAQQESLSQAIDYARRNASLSRRNPLLALAPFIDEEGLLRVGGRLKGSSFPFDKKHPILLEGKHKIAELIFRDLHKSMLHAGPQQLLATSREQFWIPGGRNLARKTVRMCVTCSRYNSRQNHPLMGELPRDRTKAVYPFYATGIDYAGPFELKDRPGRGARTSKAYIALFVCFSTRAIHLELVTNLSTEAFMATLKRFIGRRGKPHHIYSDNGRNFVGAASDIRNFLRKEAGDITTKAIDEGIRWTFIPPYSPNFGGLWEAGVKSTKYHLKRVLGTTKLHYEAFSTVLTEIEGLLNSRPLSILSSDPNDPQVLTPAHFLIGRSLVSLAEANLLDVKTNRLSKFQFLQQLRQHFWQRWSKEYLSELQQRTRWKKNCPNIKLGNIVVLKEDQLPPSQWKLGIITQLHPGEDNIVRVVSIKTQSGIVKRAVSKVCILPVNDSEM